MHRDHCRLSSGHARLGPGQQIDVLSPSIHGPYDQHAQQSREFRDATPPHPE